MPDTTNVTPPPTPKARRKRAPIERFDRVEQMLGVHQDTIYSARAVASLLAEQLRNCRASEIHELEKLIRAADAINQLLAPVEGIGSFADLIVQDEDRTKGGRTRGW
jgi:hypothetical protein